MAVLIKHSYSVFAEYEKLFVQVQSKQYYVVYYMYYHRILYCSELLIVGVTC